MDTDALIDAVMKLGVFVVAAAGLYYAVGVGRKGKDGADRSSLFVPGWVHDQMKADAKAELESQRRLYQKALNDAQDAANVRIAEWRSFRDEAVAKAADADDDRRRLLEAVTNQSRDMAVLLEISRSLSTELQRLAAGDGRQPGASRAK